MKKIFLLLTALILIGCMAFAACHSKLKANIPQADSTKTMLHPNVNTVYLDEAGKKIDVSQFGAFIKSGQYTFVPTIENGKIKSLQIKKTSKSIKPGEAAPDFSLTDIKGNHYTLNNLKGKIVVLNFWFTTCASCITEMPELDGLVDKYGSDKNIVFLAVTFDKADKVKQFLAKKEFKYNIISDQAELIKKYGISAFPTSIIVDRNGGIAYELTAYDDTSVPQLDGVLQALKAQ